MSLCDCNPRQKWVSRVELLPLSSWPYWEVDRTAGGSLSTRWYLSRTYRRIVLSSIFLLIISFKSRQEWQVLKSLSLQLKRRNAAWLQLNDWLQCSERDFSASCCQANEWNLVTNISPLGPVFPSFFGISWKGKPSKCNNLGCKN